MSEFQSFGNFGKPSADISEQLASYVQQLRAQVLYSLASSGLDPAAVRQFAPVLQASQVVSGVRWRVKVQTAANSYLHIQFVRKLDGSLQLESVATGKRLADPL